MVRHNGPSNTVPNTGFPAVDLIVVIASIVVLSAGSNGQVFATSAIRQVVISLVTCVCDFELYHIIAIILDLLSFFHFFSGHNDECTHRGHR